MDKVAQLKYALKNFIASENPNNMAFTIVQLVSVQGDTCTIDMDGTQVPGVRLMPTSGNNNKMLLTPKVGSYVLLGSLSGDWRELMVLAADEAEKIEIISGNMNIEIDINAGTIHIKNKDVSLADLFQQLSNMLKTFQVHTATGASGYPLPTTLQALSTFETDFKKLLK